MDWTYPVGGGDAGVFEIGRRLAVHLGRLPDVTSFVHDAREMLRVTRRVESAARTGTLYVGFQNAAKLDAEWQRYRDLVEAGTRVVAFATGRPAQDTPGLDYRELDKDVHRLENQWFLVSNAPEPVAFVSWEIGDPAQFGVGGATSPDKRFVGFVSDDPAVVAELVEALEARMAPPPAARTVEPYPLPGAIEHQAAELVAKVDESVIEPTNALPGSVIVPVGRSDSAAAVTMALAIARREQRQLVVVDRTAESLFTSPYSGVRADDEFRPRPDSLFGVSLAWREGRGETAAALRAADLLGIPAGAWFPTAAGADGLRVAIARFCGAVLVVPASAQNPGIGERIRGMTLDNLQHLGVAALVAGA
ncbi:MAG: hypothetical protein U5Q44_03660 [Dehalococcoidia bacterium]|nr:hypothetical protein [Dehalococcoidia bacterium]